MVCSMFTDLCNHHHNQYKNMLTTSIRNHLCVSSHPCPITPIPSHPQGTCTTISIDFLIMDISYKCNHSVCGLLSLNIIMFLSFIHVITCLSTTLHSFLLQNNIPLHGYITFYLSIHQLPASLCPIFSSCHILFSCFHNLKLPFLNFLELFVPTVFLTWLGFLISSRFCLYSF